MNRNCLLLQILRDPTLISSIKLSDWDLLIRQARRAALIGTLRALLEKRHLLELVPLPAKEHLDWAWVVSVRHLSAVRWEVHLIAKSLESLGIQLVLLKGAAYVMADLELARGRVFSDVDILVSKDMLEAVEAALMLKGWVTAHLDEYDQRYYRTWMHEIPPMQHIKRGTVIDVHHAIVPETSPVHPDPKKLREAAQITDCDRAVSVLSPADMVLHSAVHLFHDGEFDRGLRDLVDIHLLLTHFSAVPAFWTTLIDRAQEMELSRSLFYALRYASGMLGTSIPVQTMDDCAKFGPNRLQLRGMDWLFIQVLVPDHASCALKTRPIAIFLLYVRANWLRMPPWLLTRHLFHKAFFSSPEL